MLQVHVCNATSSRISGHWTFLTLLSEYVQYWEMAAKPHRNCWKLRWFIEEAMDWTRTIFFSFKAINVQHFKFIWWLLLKCPMSHVKPLRRRRVMLHKLWGLLLMKLRSKDPCAKENESWQKQNISLTENQSATHWSCCWLLWCHPKFM